MTEIDSPREWGLPPHITCWREHQLETVQWCTAVSGLALLESPTGSGKTGIAKAMSRNHRLLAVAKTKLLQQTVYLEHGFSVLMGKSNYRCLYDPRCSAEDCPFDHPDECEFEQRCPYRCAARRAMASKAASVNYSYFLTTKPAWQKRTFMFLDECHLLPSIVLEFVGISVGHDDILKWRLPRPPQRLLVDGTVDISGQNRPERGLEWLDQASIVMRDRLAELRDMDKPDLQRQAERLLARIDRARAKISQSPLVWFMVSDGERFSAKPLTARYHFADLFDLHIPTVLMSGTIGDFQTLADELGIKEYQERRVPSLFDPSRRPVYDLGAPGLSLHTKEVDWQEQARLIAKAVNSVPPEWSGVIHTTKKQYAVDLADRLARQGLQDRIWVAPQDSTDRQIAAWREHKRNSRRYRRPGQLAISWSWTEGVDLREERICISAKCLTPFMVIASPERRRGYLTINEVKPGQVIYTLGKDLNLIETTIEDVIIVNWYEGLVFNWRNRGVDVSVSADHQMIVLRNDQWVKVDMLDIQGEVTVARWRMKANRAKQLEVKAEHITADNYRGSLWCVVTEAGSILAGRMGQPNFLWMGNCPFGDLGSPYEKARFNTNRRFYLQQAAWDLQQQLSRTRRGEEDDYDTADDMRGLVAIADGNYTRVQKYLSEDFRRSIIKV